MKTITPAIILSVLTIVSLTNCKQKQTTENREDFRKYYVQFKVEGSFVLYDQNNDKFTFYNQEQYKESFSPASTFKICNSLIGLESGVIKDENFVIPWDSIVRSNPKWNQDHDLKLAFKNSTVWYFRELARRVGREKMKFWLDQAQYGNADTTGGVDLFWLKGGLRVTPEQQIDFLKRLHDNKLPFTKRSVDIVKEIMITKDTLDYVIRAKTGFSDEEKRIVGWYIGYVEKNNNVYYFSNCIQSTNLDHADFARARIEIAYKIMDDLKVTNE
ncbi:MAG: class D beta-lactamase [Bacteroidota bacterium]|nr:class D beta-lactamase [Bacteroidota bacterium]